MAYARYAPLSDPAPYRPALWRLALGLILAAIIYIIGTFAALLLGWRLIGPDLSFDEWSFLFAAPETPEITLFLLLTSFPAMALGAFAAGKFLHGRGFGAYLGRAPRVIRDFAIAAGVTFGLAAITFLPVLFVGFDGLPNLDPLRWLSILPLTLLAIIVQTGAEELAFRGYLQSQLAARFKSAFVWMLVPSLLFGLVHYNPGALGENFWLPIIVATLFGLAAADLTARTGSLGAAWGIHFANNTMGLAVIATEGTVTGLALFRTPYDAADPELIGWSIAGSAILLGLSWAITRRLTAR